MEFDPIPQSLLREVESVAGLHGWCPPVKAHDMAALILLERPSLTVEIGVFGGRSLLPQVYALRHLGVPGTKVVGIDAWDNAVVAECGAAEGEHQWWKTTDLEAVYQGLLGEIDQRGLSPWVEIIRSRSDAVSDRFADGSIDVLHIDGNHSEEISARDVRLYLPKVKPRGWIWMDDACWESLRPAIGIMDAETEMWKDYHHFRLYRKK